MATARGFRRARVSQARAWAHAAQRILRAGEYPDIELGYVAAFLALGFAHQLVFGDDKFHRRGDSEARADCPIDPTQITEWRDKLKPVRNAVLHLGEDPTPERTIAVKTAAGSVTLTVTSWRRRPGRRAGVVAEHSIPREDVLQLLERLEPWLTSHNERLRALP